MGQSAFASLIPDFAYEMAPPRRRASLSAMCPARCRRPAVQSYAEVSLGLTAVAAREETARCLRCDIRSVESREYRLDREGEGPHRRRGHRGDGRPDDPRGCASERQVQSRPSATWRPQRGRRVPAVHGPGRRVARCCPPAPPPCKRAWRSTRPRRSSSPTARSRWSCCSPSGNHVCAVCVSSGHCELQTLAQEHGSRTSAIRTTTRDSPSTPTHPRYVLDHNRCILCSRCVRTCAEIEGAHVWDMAGRGIDTRLCLRAQAAVGRSHQSAPAAASASRPARRRDG